ncbi:hypothetical protein OSTOST_19161, partial [Ostertagia ostertagi]
MYEAFAVVEKALEKEPKDGCFGAHKWYAILLDYIGEIEGNKSRLQKSYKVKEHLERALQICSSDATTWQHLCCSNSSVLPGFYSTNMYYIGEVYEKMGNRDEAMKYYKDAFKMPVVHPTNQIEHTPKARKKFSFVY